MYIYYHITVRYSNFPIFINNIILINLYPQSGFADILLWCNLQWIIGTYLKLRLIWYNLIMYFESWFMDVLTNT